MKLGTLLPQRKGDYFVSRAEGDKVEARSGAVWGDGKNMEPPLKRDLR